MAYRERQHSAPAQRKKHRRKAHDTSKQLNRRDWRDRFRPAFLASHPVCADPFDVHETDCIVVPATEVHHLKSRRDGGDVYDELNCVALCKSCHSRITATENAQKGRGG